jgi:hypothetical protein
LCVIKKPRKNEKANARYRAVENTTTMGCNAKKTNNQPTKQTNLSLYEAVSPFPADRGLCLITWPLPTACFPPVQVAVAPDAPVYLQHNIHPTLCPLKS